MTSSDSRMPSGRYDKVGDTFVYHRPEHGGGSDDHSPHTSAAYRPDTAVASGGRSIGPGAVIGVLIAAFLGWTVWRGLTPPASPTVVPSVPTTAVVAGPLVGKKSSPPPLIPSATEWRGTYTLAFGPGKPVRGWFTLRLNFREVGEVALYTGPYQSRKPHGKVSWAITKPGTTRGWRGPYDDYGPGGERNGRYENGMRVRYCNAGERKFVLRSVSNEGHHPNPAFDHMRGYFSKNGKRIEGECGSDQEGSFVADAVN